MGKKSKLKSNKGSIDTKQGGDSRLEEYMQPEIHDDFWIKTSYILLLKFLSSWSSYLINDLSVLLYVNNQLIDNLWKMVERTTDTNLNNIDLIE